MNREIKFRAWDKQNNCWYAPVHEAYKGNLFELLVSFGGDLSAHTMQGLVHESMWPDRFILMQFTGLKDKNGKEIYEGDICKDHYWEKQLDGSTILSDKWLRHRNVVIEYNAKTPFCGYIIHDWYEVIGNIYENSERI